MSLEKDYYESLKKFVLDQGFSLFGVAGISEVKHEFALSQESLKKFDKAISVGKRLLDSVVEDIQDKPTRIYFHHYRQINYFLDRGAFVTANRIQELGFQALPIPASQIIDWEKQRGHLPHKKVGALAGLGWIGRNNLLVNKKFGARFRLVTILTDMPLKEDKACEGDCGSCQKCLNVCPAQAIRPLREDFDYMACFEQLKEFNRRGFVGQYICGICVKACKGFSEE